MADFKQLYEEEIHYLNESGKEFGEAFPDIARYLNLEAHSDRDPYVERLFEGFAFLSARIREKLDDGFPEFTRNLLEMVAPESLKPFPSCTLVQFKADRGALSSGEILKKGTQLLTHSSRRVPFSCRFESTQNLAVYPVQIKEFNIDQEAMEGTSFEIVFAAEQDFDTSVFTDFNIPIFLDGDPALSWFLFYILSQRVQSVQLQCSELNLQKELTQGFHVGGMEENEALLPEGNTSLSGSPLLREFFVFPEKFRFVALPDLQELAGKSWTQFSVKVQLDKHFPESKLRLLSKNNFKLFVSPAVNLYHTNTEPIHLDQKRNEYRMVASLKEKAFVYDVLGVKGRSKSNLELVTNYQRFHRFKHFQNGGSYYELRHEVRKSGQPTAYLTLGSTQKDFHVQEEYLSIEALCTNGEIPRENVNVGDINNSAPGFPGYIQFNNLTRPSLSLPPLENTYHLWNILSQFNMNYRGLAQKDTLKEIFSLFSMQSQQSSAKLNDALYDVSHEGFTELHNGVLVRGVSVKIVFKDERIDAESYQELGQYSLMAKCLHKFFSQNVSINHLVRLELEVLPVSLTFLEKSQAGGCPLL